VRAEFTIGSRPGPGAAGREVLAAFEESSEYKHGKACYDSPAYIPESDHRQESQRQVSAEMLQFVPDVEAADRDHEGRRGGPMTTQQISAAHTTSTAARLF